MTVEPIFIWSGLLSVIIGMLSYMFTTLVRKVQELQERLVNTRESYATKIEMKDMKQDFHQDIKQILDQLKTLNEKIDNLKIKN
jgi:peptidoglycan hydrolase CwlO-like protein|tara:strand:+ start:493 stop:744 length:252 start_codon:yes stop_codon:yes gene_type:complete